VKKDYVIEGFLQALKARMDQDCQKVYCPAVVITDQGQTEINAIHRAFGFGVRIFYCSWHILQAWERKLKTDAVLGMQGLPIEEKKERRDKVKNLEFGG